MRMARFGVDSPRLTGMDFLPLTRTDDLGWHDLRDEIAPWIGERAVTLFSYAISHEYGSAVTARYFRTILTDAGDDPDHPQVTETEQLLIDWGRLVVRSPRDIPEEFYARLEAAFSPERRLALLTFAARVVAINIVNTAGRVDDRE
jgi:hypothetical protein